MTISQSEARAQVLLLAAAPRRSRRRLLDPELGVNALATVPTSHLLPGWTGPVDLVQIVDPGEPQAVLARLRTAAAAQGPLLLYVCGQLVRDHRQRLVHVALAKTSESTVRYTALPWSWLAAELAVRQPNTTGVLVDLIADPSCLPMESADLQLPPHVARWGVVAPPAKRGPWTSPAYTQALAELLRSTPERQHINQLHPLAAGQAQLAPGTVVLGPPASTGQAAAGVPRPRPAQLPPPMPSAPPLPQAVPAAREPIDLRPAIAEAMRAGHHHAASELAAQWEQQVLRTSGRDSRQMGDVLEVQATAAAASGAAVRAAERWIATAQHRLLWSPPSDGQVQLALRNAHAVWRGLDEDDNETLELGRRLAELLREARAERALATVERKLEELRDEAAPAYRPPAAWTWK